jgi:cysteine desulfurase
MDNNATTPLHPEVKEAMIDALDLYGNPSSMHGSGREAKEAVEAARARAAALIGAEATEIIFTSGGSEANNTVLKGLLASGGSPRRSSREPAEKGRNELIISAVEHPSVLETAEYLAEIGYPVYRLRVDGEGRADLEELKNLLSEKTALVSVMHGNNEIGTLQDIAAISAAAHEAGAPVHTDAVQTAGKIPVDVRELGVDYLSFSAHKMYGPKGVGALYVRDTSLFRPLVHGGHQEEGKRAGTYNTIGIVGFGKAAELAAGEMAKETGRLEFLRNRLREGILETIPDVRVNSPETECLPGTLDASFLGAEGESILLYMDMEGIEVSTGSACATGSLEPSHVLLGIGLDAEYAHGSIRFSLGRENTGEDVEYVLEKLPPIIERIRKMSTRY